MKSRYTTLLAASGIALMMMQSCTEKADYDATGIFEAVTTTISAETPGKILDMSKEEGDSVTTGEYLARIDSVTYTLQGKQIVSQIEATSANTPDITAQAASLRTQIKHAEDELARQNRLLADGATTQKMHDDAEAQVRTLQAQLQALLSTLNNNSGSIRDNANALRYQHDQVKEQISKSRLLSPLSGTILTKYAEPGEYVMPGKPLYKIANMDKIYLRSYFTVSQLADIKIGQKVTVIADFGDDKQYEYPGTITWISEESEFTPKSIQTRSTRANLVYAVKISVQNDGRLKLGQYGEVRL